MGQTLLYACERMKTNSTLSVYFLSPEKWSSWLFKTYLYARTYFDFKQEVESVTFSATFFEFLI